MIEEQWLDIVGYEGLYEVSNLGRVKNSVRNKVLKPVPTVYGYVRVCLYKNMNPTRYVVHRLVAQAFIPNPLNKPQVNHKNGIKTDNSLGNLEWNTAFENMTHAFENGLCGRGSKSHRSKLSEGEVLSICQLLDEGELTHKQISLKFGVSKITIGDINRGDNWNWLTNRKINSKHK